MLRKNDIYGMIAFPMTFAIFRTDDDIIRSHYIKCPKAPVRRARIIFRQEIDIFLGRNMTLFGPEVPANRLRHVYILPSYIN